MSDALLGAKEKPRARGFVPNGAKAEVSRALATETFKP